MKFDLLITERRDSITQPDGPKPRFQGGRLHTLLSHIRIPACALTLYHPRASTSSGRLVASRALVALNLGGKRTYSPSHLACAERDSIYARRTERRAAGRGKERRAA